MKNVFWERTAADCSEDFWIASGKIFLIQEVKKANDGDVMLYSLAIVKNGWKFEPVLGYPLSVHEKKEFMIIQGKKEEQQLSHRR